MDVGSHVFRLKQIDFDGKFEYSHIVSVDFPSFQNLESLMLLEPKMEADFYSAISKGISYHMELPENNTRSLGKETLYRLLSGTIRIYFRNAIRQHKRPSSHFLVLYGRISEIRSAAGNR